MKRFDKGRIRARRSWAIPGGVAFILWVAILSGCGEPELVSRSDQEAVPATSPLEKPDLFRAEPNPVQVCEGELGRTTLHWNVPSSATVEIHVGGPDGELFAREQGSGSRETGEWVRDGMVFYLVDADTDETIATTLVRTTRQGCEETGGSS